MDTLLQDVRFGARMLLKHRGSSILSVLALALGIGLTAMMFSIVWGAMLRGLPFEKPEQIVNVARTNIEADIQRMGVSIHDFEEYRAQQRSFVDLGAFHSGTVNVTAGDNPERFDGTFITPESFGLIGAQPLIGRVFTAEDRRPGAPRVMLLSHDTWLNHFGGSRAVLGTVVRANAEPATIVGVMPDGFAFPSDGELWLPLALDAGVIPRNEGPWLSVFGRMRDGVAIETAAQEMAVIAQRLETQYPETNDGVSTTVKPYIQAFFGSEPVTLLYTMLGAVFMVLLIACANVANLLIARAAARGREVGIRSAMGASRVRVVRQFLTESLLLSLAGAAVGLLLAWAGISLFNRAIAPTDPPFWINIRLDAGVMLFVLAITVLACLLAGSIPALQAARSNVSDVLKDESRGGSSFRLGRISRILVVTEIALSAGLLVGAGLTIRSVTKLRTLEFPFAVDELLTARVGLPEVQYPDVPAQVGFWTELLSRLNTGNDGADVALVQALPGLGALGTTVALEGVAYARAQDYPQTLTLAASAGAVKALGVAVLQGREFTGQDMPGSLPVAYVNESFVRRHFPGQDVLGRRVRLGGADTTAEWRTIVGVVPDMYNGGLDDEVQEAVYTPILQVGARFMSVIARPRAGDPLQLTQAVRSAVQDVDADLPIYDVRTLRTAIDEDNWFYMIFGSLFMVFGAAALFLASVGLYGVMSTSVGQRTREMGVRMALGAEPRNVLMLIMRQGLVQLAAGLTLGLLMTLGISRLLQMVLFDVNPRDPSTFLAIAVVLSMTAAVACLVPALRATRVDPMHALHRD